MTLVTSDKTNAGTPHNVMLVLVDVNGKKSEELDVENSSNKKLLSRGSRDVIKFVTKPLGALKTVIIGLQRRKGVKGGDDSLKWHLEELIVKDVEADEM